LKERDSHLTNKVCLLTKALLGFNIIHWFLLKNVTWIGENTLNLKESDLELYEIPCTTGMEPLCILDPDHPCCENIKREQIEFSNGILMKQGNSAIVSLKLSFNDPVEEFIFDRIRNDLWREPGGHVKVIRQPEEGYHISFFLNTEMVKTREQREKLLTYWEEFSIQMRQILTDGKMVINKYVRKSSTHLRL
jgi:hypothetical protein